MEKCTVKIMHIIIRRPILIHSSLCVLKFLLSTCRPNFAEFARIARKVERFWPSRRLLYQTSGFCFLFFVTISCVYKCFVRNNFLRN